MSRSEAKIIWEKLTPVQGCEAQGDIITETERALIRTYAVEDQQEDLAAVPVFTCDTCTANRRCPYVFDRYNTGGDCLASK